MKGLILALTLFLFPAISYAGFTEILDATAQIKVDRWRGTAVAYKSDDKYIYFLTAGHCLSHLDDVDESEKGKELPPRPEPEKEVFIRLFDTSYSKWIKAEPIWYVFNRDTYNVPEGEEVDFDNIINDLGIIKIKKIDVISEGYRPQVIPLAADDFKIDIFKPVLYNGCQAGGWPTLVRGSIETYSDRHVNVFPDTPPGLSGSGVFDYDGQYILGIILNNIGDCISAKEIRKIAKDNL